MTIFVSPSEPKKLRDIGVVSLITEEHGCDVLWVSSGGETIGVQRKQFPGDFLASVFDGRLRVQIAQMKACDVGILVLEGLERWTTEGKLLLEKSSSAARRTWTKEQHRKYLYSVRSEGAWVESTRTLDETIECITHLQEYFDKDDHVAFHNRPGPKKRSVFQHLTNRDWQEWFVQGLPDIGHKLAGRILDECGMPFGLVVSREELMKVPGVGKGKADRICKIFETDKVVEVE